MVFNSLVGSWTLLFASLLLQVLVTMIREAALEDLSD